MTNPKYKSDELEEFFEAVLMLETLEDCYKFFEDICTVRELNSISQRLEVAKLLKIRKHILKLKRKQEHQLLLSLE